MVNIVCLNYNFPARQKEVVEKIHDAIASALKDNPWLGYGAFAKEIGLDTEKELVDWRGDIDAIDAVQEVGGTFASFCN